MADFQEITRMRKAIGAGLDPSAVVNNGRGSDIVTDVDAGQVTLQSPEEVEAFDKWVAAGKPQTMPVADPSPQVPATAPRVENLHDFTAALSDNSETANNAIGELFNIDRFNAMMKYRFNEEEKLVEAKKMSEATNIPENIILSDADTFAKTQEIYKAQLKNLDFTKLFEENPALAKLAVNGNDTMAAIAMHYVPEIKEQKSYIDIAKAQYKEAEITAELNRIGWNEMYGGKAIDKKHVEDLYKELAGLQNVSFTDDPLGSIIGGVVSQGPMMLRTQVNALMRASQMAMAGAMLGGAAGAPAGGVGAIPGAIAGATTGFGVGYKFGAFEGSYNEMAGSNYLELRMQKDENGQPRYSKNEAMAIANVQAVASAGIETFALGKFLGTMGNAKGVLAAEVKDIVKNAASKEAAYAALGTWLKANLTSGLKTLGKGTATEMLEEGAQSGSDNLILNAYNAMTDRPVKSAKEVLGEALDETLAAGPASLGYAGMGTILSGSSATVRRAARAMHLQQEYRLSETRTGRGIELLNNLKQALANSKLMKKDPQTATEVLKQNLEGSGYENVYIDTAEMRRAGQDELLTQVVNTLNLSDEQKQNIISGKEELDSPVTLHQLAVANVDEKLNEYISFDASDMSFAKNKRFAKSINEEMQRFREQDAREEKEITDIILEHGFAPEERELAAKYIEDVGLRDVNKTLRTNLATINTQIDEIVKRNGPASDIIEIDRSGAYYVKGKGWGWYTSPHEDNRIISEAELGADVKEEMATSWEWQKLDASIEPEWLTRWRNNNHGRFTKAAEKQMVIDSVLGNADYGIWDEAPGQLQQDRVALQTLLSQKERLEKLQRGFDNIAKNEDVVARGLTKEGYQAYRNIMQALKNASTAEAREAAQFNAILLARHADRYAAIVREFTDNKDYSALDYMQNVDIEADVTNVKEGGLKEQKDFKGVPKNKFFSVVVSGKEFEGWSSVDELRKLAIDYYNNELKKKVKSVHNKALGEILIDEKYISPDYDVWFTNSGRDKVKSYSATAPKLLLVKHLTELLANSNFVTHAKEQKGTHGTDEFYYLHNKFSYDDGSGEKTYYAVISVRAHSNGQVTFYNINTFNNAEYKKIEEAINAAHGTPDTNEDLVSAVAPSDDIITKNVRVYKQQNVYYAEGEYYKAARGQITFSGDKSIISLLQTADQSTFAHEMGHLFLRDLEQLANMEGCPEQIKKDWETVKQWTEWHEGALDEYKGTALYGTYDEKGKFIAGEFNVLNAAIRKAVKEGNTAEAEKLKYQWRQERWARGWEEYLRQGKAPTSNLQKVFRSFKQWLCGIYKDFLQCGGAPSPEVKAVMDRMIASQEEIDMQATRSSHYSFVRAGGLNFLAESNQAMYEKYWEQAQEEAKEKVLKYAMREVEENYAQQRREFEAGIRQDVEQESYDNTVLLIQEEVAEAEDKEATLAGLLDMAKMTKEEYEAELEKLGGSRENYIENRVKQEMASFDSNPITVENIRAWAQDAINNGEYADKLNEFELAAMMQKGQIEQRIGKMADQKFAEIEKALSGIDASENTVKKINALQQRINDLRYTIRWNEAETKMLMEIQEAADRAKLEAEILSHKGDVEELKAKLKELRQELKHAEKEADVNARWAEAEKRLLMEIQEAEKKEAISQERRKQKEADYNARWREAELNFIIDEFKGKLKDKIDDFNQYRKETREGLRTVRDANKGVVRAVRDYVNGKWNSENKLSDSANERYWRRKAQEAGREMGQALARQEYTEAAMHKYNEMYYNTIATLARKNQKFMDKVEANLTKKLKTLNKNTHLSANQAYLYRSMMRVFGLDKNNYELDAPPQWEGVESLLKEMHETGYSFTDFETGLGDIPVWLYEAMNGKQQVGGIAELTAPELRDLYRFMTALYKSGSSQKIKDRLGKLESVDVVAQNIADEISDRLYTITDGKPKVNQEVTMVQKFIRGLRATHQNALNIDTICRMLGPEAENYIYNRINDAANNRLEMQKAMVLKLRDLFKNSLNNSKEFLNKKFRFNDEIITGKQIIALALNWGNETNRMRVRDGFNVTDQQVEELLANMSDNEWMFVQGVWDLFSELWPQVRDVQFRRTGSAARTEQALPFAIKDNNGKIHDVKGGYYPISYDRNQSFKVTQMLTDSAARTSVGSSAQLGSRMNSTKERKKKVTGMPLSTNLNDIGVKLEDQINIIAMKEAVDDVNVLFRNEKFRNAVVNTFGVGMMSRMNNWIGDQWNHSSMPKNTLERSSSTIRSNLTLSVLGFRLSTIVTNFANIFGVMHYIGPVRSMSALRSFYNHPVDNTKFIVENSVFIRERISTVDRDIRAAISNGANLDTGIMATVKEYNQKMQEISFFPIMVTDFMFALPLWQSEYERVARQADITKMDAEQIHQEGVRAGDAAVRRIFGSGQEQDLNEWQRGNEFTKIFTMYYSYFAVIYNAMAYSFFESRKNFKQTGSWTKAMAPVAWAGLYMILAQSIMDAAVREAFGLLGDDDDPYERIRNKSKENIVDNIVGGIPFVRQAVPYLIATATGEREPKTDVPLIYYWQQIGKVVRTAKNDKKDAYDLARECAKLIGQTTGISQTALDAIPNTVKFLNDTEKYNLMDYIWATIRDKRLSK